MSLLKICILSDEHYPHTGADTIVIINTAAALGAAGAEVELVTPKLWRRHQSEEEICAHYGVRHTFKLTRLTGWPPPKRTLRLEKLAHGLLGPIHATLRNSDLIHSRDLIPLIVANTWNLPWSFETYRRHAEEKPWLPPIMRRLGVSRAVGAIAHSKASGNDLVELGFDSDAVLVARPGISPGRFSPSLDKVTARQRCGLDVDGPIISYVGNVGPMKGTDEIVDLARRIPKARFLVVGGSAKAVAEMRKSLESQHIDNVIMVGHQPPPEVPKFLYAADVLFVPAIFFNSFSGTFSELLPLRILPGTPLKLYDYLATGRPIVSADQPHNRDLLRHEHTALMVPPSDGEATATAIQRILADPALAERLSNNSLTEAGEYTWENRGKRMLEFFETRLKNRRG